MNRMSVAVCAGVVALMTLGCDDKSKPATSTQTAKPKPTATAAAKKPKAPTKKAAATAKATSTAKSADAKDAKDDGIPTIPDKQSKPPSVDEWKAAKEVNTQGPNSRPDKCYMKIVREWLKVNCAGKVTKIEENKNFSFGRENVDFFTSLRPEKSADIVVRLKKGKSIKAKIHRTGGEKSAALFVSWPPTKEKPTIIALGISAT